MNKDFELKLLRFQAELGSVLGRIVEADRALRYALRGLREFFGAERACLALLGPEREQVLLALEVPAAGDWDREMLGAYLRVERPAVPADCLLAPLTRKERRWGVIGLRRPAPRFERGAGRVLARLAEVVSARLAELDRDRAAEVRRRIDQKIMEQLRPKDLFYQILHGLHSLTRYDHSSALLVPQPAGDALELVAEQISWHKGKSDRIGLTLPLSPEVLQLLRAGGVFGFDRQGDGWRAWSGAASGALAQLLDYNSPGDTREGALLCAPLLARDRVLALVKLAAQHPGAFGAHEASLLSDLLPQVSVAIQNSSSYESLRARILESERKNAVADLARGVSHDVNNALGSVLPLVQQMRADLESGPADAPTLIRDLEQIEDSLKVSRRIFRGMLSVARPSARQVGPCHLGRAVQATLSVLSDSLRRRDITLAVELDRELPPVRGRQGDLEQLLLNLATNARDAMPGGGKLTLRAASTDGMVEVSIEDTGEGIEPERIARIFEPFYTTKEHGTGLGLSICTSIVSDMQGTLAIDSRPGAGTRVRVRLPVGTPEPAAR